MAELNVDTVTKVLKKAADGKDFARLINAKQLKALVKAAGLRMSGDFPPALTTALVDTIAKAAVRCVGAKRSTVQTGDL